MSEHGEPDHWADLASDLGAPPAVPEEKREPEQPVDEERPLPEPEASVDTPDKIDEPAVPRRKTPVAPPAADWSQLANDLGIVSEPEPSSISAEPSVDFGAEPTPAADDTTMRAETAEPPAKTSWFDSEPSEPPAETADTASAATDEGVMFTEADEPVEEVGPLEEVGPVEEVGPLEEVGPVEEKVSGVADVLDEAATAFGFGLGVGGAEDAEPEPDAKKTGKRRRRRRRRPRKPDDAQSEPSDAESLDAEPVEPSHEPVKSDATSDDDAVEAEGPAKGKRRRRPSRKKSAARHEGDATEAHDEDETGTTREEPDDSWDDDDQPAEAADADRGERQTGSERAPAAQGAQKKASHRAIPCWEEAVGILISANLEARAKKPNGRPPRSRGGRGRGGRAKSSERPS